MTRVVGKSQRINLCYSCREALEDYEGPITLCHACELSLNADMAVGVNGSKVHLLVDEVKHGP